MFHVIIWNLINLGNIEWKKSGAKTCPVLYKIQKQVKLNNLSFTKTKPHEKAI